MAKPKIRFKGYTDEWEQRKLSDVIKEIATGKSVNSEDVGVSEKEIGVLKTSCVSYNYFNHAEAKKVKDEEIGLVRCPVVKNTIIISRMNTPDKVGACGYVAENHDNLFLPDRLWRLTFNEETEPYFIFTELISETYKTSIKAMASGTSGSMHNIPKDLFLKLEVNIPSLIEEQKKISEYFSNIDNLITLHLRKCDETKKLKKYMLQKMFPRNGEKVPQIRFKGFTEDWEQRKLGDITTKIGSGKTPKGGAAAYKDDGIALIRSQNVNGDRVDLSDIVFIDKQTDEDMKNSRVQKGDVLLNITGASIGRSAVFTRDLRANVNQHVCIIRTKGSDVSPEFIQLNIISSSGQNQIDAFQAGGGREGLNFQQIGKIEFLYPGIKEQQKIGQYFANLDYLITLHQHKCEELKKMKRFMLQNMFS